jgi:ABC-2 type transport system permease protein
MINLLLAEWKKTVWNILLTGFLVWAFPVGVFAFYLVMMVAGLISRDWMEGMLGIGTGFWTGDAFSPWGMLLAFPFTILSRMMPLAFMAAVFAGEYQSGMWKNLIPRARRWKLILTKIAVIVLLMTLALALTSVITVAGQGAGHLWAGREYGPEVSWESISDFAVRYGQTVLLGAAVLILLADIAALAARFTRSALGSLMVVFLVSTLDSLSMWILMLVARIFSIPGIVHLYRYTMQCSIDNVQSWFQFDRAVNLPFENFPAGPDLGFSLVMLALWCAGLTASAIILFERQDITS